MSNGQKQVSLVIPLFNEEEMLSILITELEAFRKDRPEITEIIFVNDGSRDKTEEKAIKLLQNKNGYVFLSFTRNFGHQIAVSAALDYVTKDAAIIMDADLQDPLTVAGEMIDTWEKGFDVVYGIRSRREGEGWFKRTSAAVFYRFFKWITDLDMPLDTGDFRLLSKEVISSYQKISEQQPFVRGLIAWLGYNQAGIYYKRNARKAGNTKYPFRKMLRLASHAITSFSDKPLRIATQVGVATSFLALIGMIWVFYARLVLDSAVPGWASSLVIILFLGGIQMLFLGIIGVYIARIYAEVKQRPRYIIKGIWHSTSQQNSPSVYDESKR